MHGQALECIRVSYCKASMDITYYSKTYQLYQHVLMLH